MSADDEAVPSRPAGLPFTPRRRAQAAQPGTSPDRADDSRSAAARELAEELDRIEQRIARTAADGRAAFFEGSDSYDRASMAIISLAALFENDKLFGSLLATTTDVERRGIARTRSLIAHIGYAALDEDVFWETATDQAPAFIQKIRSANGMRSTT